VSKFDGDENGLKVAIKDSINIDGYPTQLGSALFADSENEKQSAEIVNALVHSGKCHIIGKTVLHELAYGMTGINDFSGTPLNTKYPELITGGSSSGSAVAVAEELVDFAIGTDTGGSIRVPAACCGIYGLKPTYGRVSRVGVKPETSSLDCVGPLANSVKMIVTAMSLIDDTFIPENHDKAYKIGLIDTACEFNKDIENRFKESKVNLHKVNLPLLEEAFEASMQVIGYETWLAYGKYSASNKIGKDVSDRLKNAKNITVSSVASAELVRNEFSANVDEILGEYDVLISPTLSQAPISVMQAKAGVNVLAFSSLVRPFNLSGHPAISLPFETNNGVPIGLQIIGRKGADERLCQIAQSIDGHINKSL
jgi:amidase